MINIRYITEDDAESFINLYKKLDEETMFILYNPNERKISIENQKNEIKSILKSKNSIVLLSECNNKLVGYLGAYGRSQAKIKHITTISIGILQEYVGIGIGTMLFEKLEEWAKSKKIHRLELTVMENNPSGQALYKKMGFEIEGIKRDSICINDKYINDIYMSKLI